MKKNVLALSVALALGGLAGQAQAATKIAEGGVGHNLVLPYYTVQQGQATLLNIVNTDTVNGKAVKVRFRGAVDSDDVADFQVFLSPGDVWTANVSSVNGVTHLSTNDRSCTIPTEIRTNGGADFAIGRLATDDTIGAAEGYVEIFNMADIPPYLAKFDKNGQNWSRPTSFSSGVTKNPLWNTIKHKAPATAGAPWNPDCDAAYLENIETGFVGKDGLVAIPSTYTPVAAGGSVGEYAPLQTEANLGATAALTGVWTVGAAYAGKSVMVQDANGQQAPYLGAPTKGLFGNWMIINTKDFAAYGGTMTSVTTDQPTRIVYSSQLPEAVTAQNLATDFPSVRASADAVLLQKFVTTAKYDFPDVSTPYELNDTLASVRARDFSQAILVSKVENEFYTTTAEGAATDFVFSQPTRRYHVAGRVGVSTASSKKPYDSKTSDTTWAQLNSNEAGAYLPSLPYANVVSIDTKNGHRSCVKTGSQMITDREEYSETVSSKPVISPNTVAAQSDVYLCNEAGVISINRGKTLAANGAFTGAISSYYTPIVVNGAGLQAGASDLAYSNAYLKNTGWISWNLTSTKNTLGLPLLGQVFMKVLSNGVAGFGANTPHRFTASAGTLPVPTVGAAFAGTVALDTDATTVQP